MVHFDEPESQVKTEAAIFSDLIRKLLWAFQTLFEVALSNYPHTVWMKGVIKTKLD